MREYLDSFKTELNTFLTSYLKIVDSEDEQSQEAKETRGQEFASLVLFLLTFYMRENCVGPSVYTEYVEDTLAPLIKGHLPKTDFDPFSTKNKQLMSALLHHFAKDGETVYHKSQFLVFMYILECLLTNDTILSQIPADYKQFAVLQKARLYYLLDVHLTGSVINFKD